MININNFLRNINKITTVYNKYGPYILVISVLIIFFYMYWVFFYSIPDLRSVKGYYPNLVSEVYSSDGRLIGEFAINRRKLISFDKIPQHVKDAFIAVEDQRFYEHKGIDIRSIVAAMIENIRAVDWVRGASTITQQVSKNLSLSFEKSITRKIKEAVIAYRMENYLSKDEILYIYLNHIYLADGVYGVESASNNYFGKSASELNIAEAALLAGLPRRPEYYSPRRNLKRSLERQRLVLNKMYEQNYIDAQQKKEAINFEIKIKPKDDVREKLAPYFMDMVKRYIEDTYGEKYFFRGGLKIFTSLDVDMSREANWALRRGLLEIEQRHNKGIIIKNISSINDITSYLLSQNIKDLKQGKTYRGVVMGSELIDSNLFSATVSVGLIRAKMFYSTDRTYRTNIKSIQENIIEKNPRYSFDYVMNIPFRLKKGDVIDLKIVDKIDNEYYCTIDYEPGIQGALLSVDNNGYIKAITGGYDFNKSQFNRALQAKRQPGSVFKPLVYSAAIDKGYTQVSTLHDTPVNIKNWKPENYDKKYLGKIPLRQALVKSRNLATVNLIEEITPGYVVKYARKFGISSNLDPYPSLALGSSVVSVSEIAQVFSVFANEGYLLKPKYLYRIYDRNDKLIYNDIKVSKKFEKNYDIDDIDNLNPSGFIDVLKNKKIVRNKTDSSNRSIRRDTAYIMTDMLKAVITEGTGRGAKTLNNLAPVAGKTGTTNDFTDAWFAGYSPSITTVVWVGRDDNKPIGNGESGSRAALPIWFDFMADALIKYPRNDFTRPNSIKIVDSLGRIAFKAENTEGIKRNTQYTLRKYVSKDRKKIYNKTKMKDFKQVLKDAFLLPNP